MRGSEAHDTLGKDNDDGRYGRAVALGLRGIVMAAMLTLLLLAAARLVAWTASQQVSFDGAMNLEVARSLAEGHGYRRLYADRSGFSHEIQTRAPFILPAAAVFATFGVGIWQAQLVNLVYALAFCALVFCAVRRVASPLWGIAAAAVVAATPGIEIVGMNGYGELPALTWWLAGVLVLFGSTNRVDDGGLRAFAAGVLIGVAVVTKTVLLIGLVACVPPYLSLLKAGQRPNTMQRGLLALAIGVIVPLAIHEAWHAIAMGGIAAWRQWMHDEITAVHMQAGTHPGFHSVVGGIAKAHAHFGILADAVGLHALLLAAAMVGVVVLAAAALRTMTQSPARALIATLLIFAVIYFAWWLLMTPTQKAWYRRVFNGVVVFEVVSVMLLATAWRLRARLSTPAAAAVLFAGCGIGTFYAVAWSRSLAASNWPSAAAAAGYESDARALANLPSGTHLYGVAWYSAPRVALYGGRRIDDLTLRTPAQLEADHNAFLVLDSEALAMKVGGDWLQRFNGQPVAATNGFTLYRLDTSFKPRGFSGVTVDAAALRDEVDFTRHDVEDHGVNADDYPYLIGFHEREGEGWRWSQPEAAILLHHADERYFTMDLYALDDRSYATPGGLAIDVRIDGCHLGRWQQSPQGGNVQLRLPLAPCAVATDKTVEVRLIADHVVEANNNRWLAYIVHRIGFGDANPATR